MLCKLSSSQDLVVGLVSPKNKCVLNDSKWPETHFGQFFFIFFLCDAKYKPSPSNEFKTELDVILYCLCLVHQYSISGITHSMVIMRVTTIRYIYIKCRLCIVDLVTVDMLT